MKAVLRYILQIMSTNLPPTKILYCITKSAWGGAQRYVYDLATALPRDKFDVAVIAGGHGPLFLKLAEAGIPAIPVSALERDLHTTNELRAFFALLSLYIKKRPDVIHLNSSKMGVTGAVAGKVAALILRKKIKIIFTAHGWAFNEDRSPLQKKILSFIVRVSSWFQDTIITINTRDYEEALTFISASKLVLIFNSIIPGTSLPHAQTNIKNYIPNYKASELTVGTIAELTKNKGISYLLQALGLLNNRHTFHTVIVGDGEDREKLVGELAARGLETHVTMTGFLPDAAQYISAFDIFVLPSVKEGLPYAILEAMSAGIPVIATDVGGLPDLIRHRKNGFLVPPKNAAKLADAINRLVNDKNLRDQFSRSTKILFTEKFNFRAMIKATVKLYRLS